MAKRVITTTELTDDIDGGKADTTVAFAWSGASYEIDLSKSNARAFEKAVKPYVDNARRVRASRAGRSSKPSAKFDLAAVREWAHSNGYEVSDRGRVPGIVLDAYSAAH